MLHLDRGAEALPHIQSAIELDQQRAADYPNDSQAQLDLSFSLSEAASWYAKQNDPARACSLFLQVADVRRKLVAADPANVFARGRLIFALRRAASSVSRTQGPRHAIPLLEEAIQHGVILQRTAPGDGVASTEFAYAHALLAATLLKSGATKQVACAHYGQSIRIFSDLSARKALRVDADEDFAGIRRDSSAAGCG
jgi:hypothetical protein